MSKSDDNNNKTLNLQDLIILKQFLEKGFRENFFTKQENAGAKHEHNKLNNIIREVLVKNINKNDS